MSSVATSATVEQQLEQERRSVALLREDRATLTEQLETLGRQHRDLEQENSALSSELRKARAEIAQLTEQLAEQTARVQGTMKATAGTRSLRSEAETQDFVKRFKEIDPSVGASADECFVDSFTASHTQIPGTLFVSTRHVCWEPVLPGSIVPKISLSLAKVAAVSKNVVQLFNFLKVPVQGLYFEIWMEPEQQGAKGVVSSFRAAQWYDILKSVCHQASLLGKRVRVLADGKDQPDLLK